jgi:hypothetical protein
MRITDHEHHLEEDSSKSEHPLSKNPPPKKHKTNCVQKRKKDSLSLVAFGKSLLNFAAAA